MKENKIAELLIFLRKDAGFTQSDLADKLDVTFQAVSKWERGENLPDAFTLVELAKIYGITVDEILKGEVVKKETTHKSAKRKTMMLMFAVAMIIVAPVSIFIYGTDNYHLYVPVILIITAISVMLMIYATISTERMQQYSKLTKDQKRKEEIIYAVCVGIFLILGLAFNLFYISWIVFIFGYALTLAIKK